MPNLLRKSLNYLHEETKWLLAGSPVVTEEVRAFRRAQCDACEKRDPVKDECTLCGCPLRPTALGDKLAQATSSCPYVDAQGKPAPKWLATYGVEEGPAIEEPIPTWRQVLSWIDDAGKPIYVDGLTLRPDDVVVQHAFLERTEGLGQGFGRTWDNLRNLISPDFTGKLPVVISWDYWRSGVTGEMKAEVRKGFVRFSQGQPVEVIAGS